MKELKNNLEQVWKEEARKAYRDQQSQDNDGGCREPIGFVQGYLDAKKSDFEEIKTLKEQLAAEIKQREKAENILKVSADINLSGWETYRTANQYFAEKEKQDKENKENDV